MWWRKVLHKFFGVFGLDWPKLSNTSSDEPDPRGAFEQYLADKMSAPTARKVVATFEKLQLPVPEEGNFLKGTEGALVFVNRYGVVLRVEKTKPEFTDNIVRLDHNPLVLRPIASIRALDAIVEICPGSHSTNSEKESQKVKDLLAKSGVDYWDDGAHNTGRLPVKTAQFPNGVPIVIDRLAVSKMSERLGPVKELLKRLGLKKDPQETLYGPLTKAFRAAWRSGKPVSAQKMKDFWERCEAGVKKGDLIAGWNEPRKDTYKISEARREARYYERQLAGV